MRNVAALIQDIKAADAWVFNGGLAAPSGATVLRLDDTDVTSTDGPFIEGKEHLGGFMVIRAPDLQRALEWGRRAARALTLPIEVRAFQDGPSA